MAKSKHTIDSVKTDFPVGSMIKFYPGHNADEVTAKVTGHRESGEPGQRGYSVFIDTVEDRGERLVAKERSVRPGTCRKAA